jgi:hypothetical protein
VTSSVHSGYYLIYRYLVDNELITDNDNSFVAYYLFLTIKGWVTIAETWCFRCGQRELEMSVLWAIRFLFLGDECFRNKILIRIDAHFGGNQHGLFRHILCREVW